MLSPARPRVPLAIAVIEGLDHILHEVGARIRRHPRISGQRQWFGVDGIRLGLAQIAVAHHQIQHDALSIFGGFEVLIGIEIGRLLRDDRPAAWPRPASALRRILPK